MFQLTASATKRRVLSSNISCSDVKAKSNAGAPVCYSPRIIWEMMFF